jgi:hypothetical protein
VLGFLLIAGGLYAGGAPRHAAPLLDAPAAAGKAAPTVPVKAVGGKWKPQGPAPISPAQVENIVPGDEAVGAIHVVTAHPTSSKTLYVGTVNGGVWKTANATSSKVKWQQLTDFQSSLSIGALEFDPTDSRHKTLVAGVGLWSSFGRLGGLRTGLLRTTNGGSSWQAIDGGGILVGKNVAGVAARGSTLVVAVNIADLFTFGNIGIWRSIDGGATFTQIGVGNGAATGLPGGVTFDLVGDPNDQQRLFTSVVFADLVGGVNGVYRSGDTGATWTKVSSPAMDALLISGVTSNVELAVGKHNNVYAAIANSGRLAGLFRSGDGGTTWTALDRPQTGPNVNSSGLHPGGQASIHLSIVADPTDADVVYVGGDRQPFTLEDGLPFPPQFPNAIGAFNFSGRLFRIDATKPAGSQFTHMTNSNAAGPAGGGTASGSSPHADSREMDFDAAGNLIEVDDGGIYKRTSPRDNTGDWFSLNGDIQVSELHDVSFDTLANVGVGGLQDNGTPMQNKKNDKTWFLWVGGDGGDVAIDDSDPELSIRYTSAQGLQAFNRSFWDKHNVNQGFVFVGLNVIGGGAAITGQFATPIELNAVDPFRIVIGGGNGVYESFDQGDTIAAIGPGIVVNGTGFDPIGYGYPGNPDYLLVGSTDRVFVRTAPPPAPLLQSLTYPGTGSGRTVRDVVIDQDTGSTFLTNLTQVWHTPDQGATWIDVSGNIQTFAPVALRAITYVTLGGHGGGDDDDDEGDDDEGDDAGGDALVVSTFNGIFVAREADGFAVWNVLGEDLPKAPILDVEFDADNKVVVAGTLGRGTWHLKASSINDDDDDDDDDDDEGDDDDN